MLSTKVDSEFTEIIDEKLFYEFAVEVNSMLYWEQNGWESALLVFFSMVMPIMAQSFLVINIIITSFDLVIGFLSYQDVK